MICVSLIKLRPFKPARFCFTNFRSIEYGDVSSRNYIILYLFITILCIAEYNFESAVIRARQNYQSNAYLFYVISIFKNVN